MKRAMAALAVAVVLVLAAGVPALAQTQVQLRYWSTNVDWGIYRYFDEPMALQNGTSMNSNLWGFSLRHPFMEGDWAASFSLDTGAFGMMRYVGPVAAQNGSEWSARFWNVNLHRNFTAGRTALSLFAGWGSAALVLDPASYRQSGFRVGADARFDVRDGWYLTGGLAYGPSGQAKYELLGGPSSNFNARVLEWNAGVGRSLGKWGLEGGYRVIHWNWDQGFNFNGGATAASPETQGVKWSGWYLGLNLTLP